MYLVYDVYNNNNNNEFRFKLLLKPLFPEITPGQAGPPQRLRGEPLEVAEAGIFTGRMLFLSPNK